MLQDKMKRNNCLRFCLFGFFFSANHLYMDIRPKEWTYLSLHDEKQLLLRSLSEDKPQTYMIMIRQRMKQA